MVLVSGKPTLGNGDYGFALLMWLASRLTIILAMVAIAPRAGWGVFAAWDSDLYRHIVANGYSYDVSRQEYWVAFFPLFPLLIKGLMLINIPFEIAGFIINNLSFLLAILLIFNWTKELYGIKVSCWTIVALTWCPFSLFGTVIYTEGLFLLLSCASLRAFQKKQHLWAAIWGSLATAARLPGIALVPTFLWTSWQEKRPLFAYLSSLGAGAGVVLYSIYCWLKFADPLAFLKAQKAWQPAQDFWGQDWLKMFMQVIVGSRNWKAGTLADPWHPLAFILICLGIYWLGHSGWRLGKRATLFGFCFLALILWLVAGTPLLNTVTVLGGVYLLWHFRAELNLLATYGFCSFAIIFSSGRATSAERYTYGIISVSIALGLWLERHPRWRYPLSIFFAFFLASLSVRFAQRLWAG